MNNTAINLPLESEIEIDRIEGIDTQDYPDFVDAFVVEAHYSSSGISLTEAELAAFNEHFPDIVQAKALEWVLC
jgi:hypothetical protein